jgi:rod shape-determining protein MreC
MTRLQARSILVVALLAASLGLLGLNQSGLLAPVKNVLSFPLITVQKWAAQTWNGAANLFHPALDAAALAQRNAELEAQVTELQAKLVKLDEDEADLKILSGLLNYARSQPENHYLAANVIGRDPSPFLSYILLERGSNSGVTKDMVVVTDNGLVGRVVEVTSAASKVLLITDSSSAVNARLQKSREAGVVAGQLAGGLQMQYISQQAVMEPGDLVLTSGLGGTYPADIVIGTVNAVHKLDYEVLQNADLTPGADFKRLEMVLIITNFKPVSFSPFLQATATPLAP